MLRRQQCLDDPRVFGQKIVVQRKEGLYREMESKKRGWMKTSWGLRHANRGCRQDEKEVGPRHVVGQHATGKPEKS